MRNYFTSDIDAKTADFHDAVLLQQHPKAVLDLLMFAIGFAPSSKASPAQQMDGTIIGQHGRSLHNKRRINGFGNMFGLVSKHFPNIFFYGVAGVGPSPSLTPFYNGLSGLAAHIVAVVPSQAGGFKKLFLDVSKEAEDSCTDHVQARSHYSGPGSLRAKE